MSGVFRLSDLVRCPLCDRRYFTEDGALTHMFLDHKMDDESVDEWGVEL